MQCRRQSNEQYTTIMGKFRVLNFFSLYPCNKGKSSSLELTNGELVREWPGLHSTKEGAWGRGWGERVKVSQTFGSCMYCLKCKETPSENDFQSSL